MKRGPTRRSSTPEWSAVDAGPATDGPPLTEHRTTGKPDRPCTTGRRFPGRVRARCPTRDRAGIGAPVELPSSREPPRTRDAACFGLRRRQFHVHERETHFGAEDTRDLDEGLNAGRVVADCVALYRRQRPSGRKPEGPRCYQGLSTPEWRNRCRSRRGAHPAKGLRMDGSLLRQRRKPRSMTWAFDTAMVAGAGFEPATFGL